MCLCDEFVIVEPRVFFFSFYNSKDIYVSRENTTQILIFFGEVQRNKQGRTIWILYIFFIFIAAFREGGTVSLIPSCNNHVIS